MNDFDLLFQMAANPSDDPDYNDWDGEEPEDDTDDEEPED